MTHLPEFLFTLAAMALFFATLGGAVAAWECWVDRPRSKVNRKVSR